MFESEEPTSYSTYPLITRNNRFEASSPELFSPILDNKSEETEGPTFIDTQTLDVSEDFHEPANEEEDAEAEDDESVTTSDEEEEEEGEESGVEFLATLEQLPVQGQQTHHQQSDADLNPISEARGVSTATAQAPAVPAVDQPSQVSILGGRYLLIANPPGSTSSTCSASSQSSQPVSTSSKNVLKCVHVETREQFLCKVVPRNAVGLNLLAAYHQLSDFANCVNSIHEIILSPKSFYLIFPTNYGNVHAYLLAKKRLREDEAAHLFRQMVTAVKHCHSKGIVLRDLKLGKFVFTDKERTTIKLETLEDAVVLSKDGDDGLSDKHGCPNYVSPEKAEILRTNSKYPGKATDIWGLGVMLYTMLVGRYPFNDPDHGKLFVKIRKGTFTIPECLSQNVKCVIRCLLRKDPASRLSCDEILRHPWIVDQGRHSQTFPRANFPLFQTAPEIFHRGTRRGFEAVENSNDDQVVPVWTPPPKKTRVDGKLELEYTHLNYGNNY